MINSEIQALMAKDEELDYIIDRLEGYLENWDADIPIWDDELDQGITKEIKTNFVKIRTILLLLAELSDLKQLRADGYYTYNSEAEKAIDSWMKDNSISELRTFCRSLLDEYLNHPNENVVFYCEQAIPIKEPLDLQRLIA